MFVEQPLALSGLQIFGRPGRHTGLTKMYTVNIDKGEYEINQAQAKVILSQIVYRSFKI